MVRAVSVGSDPRDDVVERDVGVRESTEVDVADPAEELAERFGAGRPPCAARAC
ncbi:hypothetical protein GS426_20060 [Rhodococcus hoagii]|nr:hypothetical protein [Prescottella equi]